MIEVGKLTDAQRRAGIERIREDLALRSGAGCGKTLVLTRRFAELLISSGGEANPLDRLAAVTFTEKAAMEMTTRVRKFLTSRAAEARSETDRRKWRQWVQELPEARISTIHAFCARLLRTHAVEAGLDPGFAVCADDLLAGRLRIDSAEQALLSAVESEKQYAMEVLNLFSFDAAVGVVTELLQTRTSRGAQGYSDTDSVLDRWREFVRLRRERRLTEMRQDAELLAAAEAMPKFHCDDQGDKLVDAHQGALTFAAQLLDGTVQPDAAAARAAAEVNLQGGKQANWGGKEAKAELVDSLKLLRGAAGEWAELIEGLGEADELAAKSLVTLIRLADEANRLYAGEKRRRGLLDFDDLLLETHKLLTDRPELTARLRGGIGQLLLDEAQDTGALEVELLKMLTGGDGEGRLFLVGDDKQSIYRFRGAQVEVFRDWCAELGADRLENLDLSFRTHPAGVAFINHLFAQLMGEHYTPIQAHRKQCPPHPSVEVVLATSDERNPIENSDGAWRAQADVTAEIIRGMLDDRRPRVRNDADDAWRPVRQGDISVLLTRMTNTAPLERALAQRGIDYYVVAGSGFFRRQEVLDLLNVLRAIDDPTDDVAFVGVLRSEMGGLDDESLLRLGQAYSRPYFPAVRDGGVPAGFDADQADICRRAVAMLGELHSRKDSLGIDELLTEVLEKTGFEATLLSRFQGRRMVGNVRRAVELARQASGSGLSLAEFVRQMSEQTAEESRYEQAAVSGEQEDVVRIMTVHKAKGLEFPVVVLPDLNRSRQGPRGPLLSRLDWGLTLDVSPPDEQHDAAKPLSFRLAKAAETDDQQSEDIRTLYVAATRHRDHLVLVGADLRNKNGDSFKGDNTLSQLDEVFGLLEAVDAGRATIEYGGGYELAVTPVKWGSAQARRTQWSEGEKVLRSCGSAEELAERISRPADALGDKPPLLGPLPVETGDVEVAVTALGDFARCPLLYRRRYELRMPPPERRDGRGGDGPDALTLGMLYHRAMELVDFDRPQPADVLIRRAAADTELSDDADLDALTAELEDMLAALRGTELWADLRNAETTFRELDFLLEASPAVLRGQIDLLAGWSDGTWQVLDYKSDRVGDGRLAEHAAGYELQMLSYAIAAGRYLGKPPTAARLVFLRSGGTYDFEITEEKLAKARDRIGELARRLVEARRTGRFERRASQACGRCPYARLCDRG